MIRPILNFARMPVWEYDFAPHDAGMYPSCSGQLYGTKNDGSKYHGKIDESGLWEKQFANAFSHVAFTEGYHAYDFNSQMPVEESANLLIVTLGICRATHNTEFFQENADLFGKWVNYLTKYGLYPENQLCTDDFAGHLKNNVNLAIKADGRNCLLCRTIENGRRGDGSSRIPQNCRAICRRNYRAFPKGNAFAADVGFGGRNFRIKVQLCI